jgi:hypothetical protein
VPSDAGQQITANRVPQVVAVQIQAIDDTQCRRRPVGLSDRTVDCLAVGQFLVNSRKTWGGMIRAGLYRCWSGPGCWVCRAAFSDGNGIRVRPMVSPSGQVEFLDRMASSMPSTVVTTRIAALTLTLGLLLAGCSATPADRPHICSEYTTLSNDAANDNGLVDNDVFDSAGRLADLADRYTGRPNLSRDAAALQSIATSDSTNLFQISAATQDIGELCDTSFTGLGGDGGLADGLGGSNGAGNYAPDTTTTTEPTQPSQPTDESAALAALQETAARDRSEVDALAGQWVPQLSSKADGIIADGITYDDLAIWQQYQQLAGQYAQVLLVWSGDYTSFTYPNYWVVIMPVPVDSGAAANSWCDAQNIPDDQCYAKLISHTAGPKGSSVTR